jgi:hypothetical protein
MSKEDDLRDWQLRTGISREQFEKARDAVMQYARQKRIEEAAHEMLALLKEVYEFEECKTASLHANIGALLKRIEGGS